MINLTLNIADIKLNTAYKNIKELPQPFNEFKMQAKNSNKNIWHLESLALDKADEVAGYNLTTVKKKIASIQERFKFVGTKSGGWKEKENNLMHLPSRYPYSISRLAFYFNDPVEIDLKKRRIRHFYIREGVLKKRGAFDSRLIAFAYSQILASLGGMLLHCACVIREGKAYLFFAKAGGGKSTVAKLSRKYSVLGDDIIAVRKNRDSFFAFPTPWTQKVFIKPKPQNFTKIKAVFFLKKSKNVHFESLRPEEALVRTLSQQIHFLLYTESPLVEKIFFAAADFFKTIPAYEMYFRKKSNFWPELEEAIK